KAGCIGCGKCEKVCAFGAITIENNLAYIDPQKCKLCRKCVNECPTGAIKLIGMEPLPKVAKAAPAATKPAGEAAAAPKAVGGPATIALKASGSNPLLLVHPTKAVMESKAATSVEGSIVELKESGKNPLCLVRGKKA
ncbi:MAG: 4Fe-4S binding protein, partial [Alistipes sp.]|nr:4Fe-4S binding protein [Alistipes sp.]